MSQLAVPSLTTITRLVQADMMKLARYWVVIVGYAAMLLVSVPGAMLYHLAETTTNVTSESGYAFAFAMMIRSLDFSQSVLFMMMCLLFTVDVANSTLKYILTRPVTRMELLLSKYATSMIMIAATIVLLWVSNLGMGWWYYGLGDLTENEYVIFEASTVFRHIGIATLWIALGLLSTASLAIAVSTYSATMGGAIVIGLIVFFIFSSLTIIPASMGFNVDVGGETYLVPWSTAAFMNQLFVPMYMLDDLPSGVPIDSWWTWDVQRMAAVSALATFLFFILAAVGIHKRDVTL
jgi:ABC-type transport system involved in multi-copper enzyme maturation permease subunit